MNPLRRIARHDEVAATLQGCPRCGQDREHTLVRVAAGIFVCDVCLHEFVQVVGDRLVG